MSSVVPGLPHPVDLVTIKSISDSECNYKGITNKQKTNKKLINMRAIVV